MTNNITKLLFREIKNAMIFPTRVRQIREEQYKTYKKAGMLDELRNILDHDITNFYDDEIIHSVGRNAIFSLGTFPLAMITESKMLAVYGIVWATTNIASGLYEEFRATKKN